MLKWITAIRLQISACKQSYFDSSFEFSAAANWITIEYFFKSILTAKRTTIILASTMFNVQHELIQKPYSVETLW